MSDSALPTQLRYCDLMKEGTPFIEFKLSLDDPPALLDLVSAFAAVGHQFETYLAKEHPSLRGAAQLYVEEIRKGSIVAQLIPVIMPLVQAMDSVLVVDGFVRYFGGILNSYIGGQKQLEATKSDLKDFLGAVAIVANDPNGTSLIASATYHATKTTTHAEFHFDTAQAKQARDVIERQRIEIDLPAFEERENVLMRFYQSNIGDTAVGSKKTGERALIEAIWPKPLGVVYATELAREKIKHETREDERNLYKKGFFVDCYVERSKGRPVAYRIVAVRDVIDLPGED